MIVAPLPDLDHRGKLGMIEAARAAAAIAVVFFHADTLVAKYLPGAQTFSFLGLGERGVDFFFVLSGFIITYIHGGHIGRRNMVARFTIKRIIRIYPLLWVVVSATVLSNILIDNQSYSFIRLWTSYTLWPSLEWPNPSAVWTLRHEILFYGLFGLAIFSRRAGFLVVAFWLAATLAQTGLLFAGHTLPGISAMLFSPLNLQFASGCIVAIVFRNRGDLHWRATLVAGLTMCAAISAYWLIAELSGRRVLDYSNPEGVGLDLAFAMIFGLLVHGLAGASHHFKTPRTLLLGGAASYAIYLVHASVLGIAARFLPYLLPANGLLPATAQLLLSGVAVSAGVILHLAYEKPVGRAISVRLFPTAGAGRCGWHSDRS